MVLFNDFYSEIINEQTMSEIEKMWKGEVSTDVEVVFKKAKRAIEVALADEAEPTWVSDTEDLKDE